MSPYRRGVKDQIEDGNQTSAEIKEYTKMLTHSTFDRGI